MRWDTRYLKLAREVASWSKDPSTQVGSVAVNDLKQVISLGYNGMARGIRDDERLHDRELKYKMILHAEQNVLLNATQCLRHSTVYVWPFMPCSTCAAVLIQAGVTRVVSVKNDTERWQDSFKLTASLFAEAGVTLVLYPEEVLNATG